MKLKPIPLRPYPNSYVNGQWVHINMYKFAGNGVTAYKFRVSKRTTVAKLQGHYNEIT